MGVEPRWRIGPFVMSGWLLFLVLLICCAGTTILGLIELH